MRTALLLLAASAFATGPITMCIQHGAIQYASSECRAGNRRPAIVPKLNPDIAVASATRSPWIDSNAWKYRRDPAAAYTLDAPPASAELACAEALAFDGNLLLHAASQDRGVLEAFEQFSSTLPHRDLPGVADFSFLDDGSPQAGEILNLLARRNLLFHIAHRPEGAPPPLVQIGQGEFTRELAANPSDFAYAIRRKIGDDRRSLRVFGSEMVIARLLGNGKQARLYVVNYNTSPIDSVRFRVRGRFPAHQAYIFNSPGGRLQDFRPKRDFIEFTVSNLRSLAVVDLQ
jgi:hypothetical protein